MSNTFNINNLNAFLAKASDAVLCNSECQKKRTSEKLKQKYLDSQTNLATASQQVQVAEKNYVTFTKGELAYHNLHQDKINQTSEQINNTFQNNFDEESKKIKSQLETYNGVLINFTNIVDLYANYKKENIELYKKLKDETSDVLTSERKTYYQDQGIDYLKFFYNYILLLIYGIFVISFAILSFVYPSNMSWKIRLAILVALIILPFISTFLLGLVISLLNKVKGFLPKNVHLAI
jgi:hypothetical protein